jgi:hypothetical protein
MQELAGGVEMARHMKCLLNYLRHALRGPQFCAVAMGDGTLQ